MQKIHFLLLKKLKNTESSQRPKKNFFRLLFDSVFSVFFFNYPLMKNDFYWFERWHCEKKDGRLKNTSSAQLCKLVAFPPVYFLHPLGTDGLINPRPPIADAAREEGRGKEEGEGFSYRVRQQKPDCI